MSNVFISYSRKDQEFVKKLTQALQENGQDTWVDWQDIPISADWWKEIEAGIEKADTFVFVISPDSVKSKVCRREINHAVKYNKRIIPILRREDYEKQRLHPTLGKHNWLKFRENDSFNKAFQLLIETVNTDLEYVKNHTRLTVQASEWLQSEYDSSYLLTGKALTEAELWIERSYSHSPQPTDFQRNFILASQSSETASLVYRNSIAYIRNFLSVIANFRISRRYLWPKSIEIIFYSLIILCSGVKLFDYTYIPFRDFYLKLMPALTVWYGEAFKGIEPLRITEAYLGEVDSLQDTLELRGMETPEVRSKLASLRQRSVDLLDDNPFAITNKSGTLERIKQNMRDRTDEESAKAAFRTFWSQEYLSRRWSNELVFFDTQIRPWMETAYWRGIGFNGLPTERFWRIEIWFISLLSIEMIFRLSLLMIRQKLSIKAALAIRWYDIFPMIAWGFGKSLYFFYFVPLVVRSYHLGLLDNFLDAQPKRSFTSESVNPEFVNEEKQPLQR